MVLVIEPQISLNLKSVSVGLAMYFFFNYEMYQGRIFTIRIYILMLFKFGEP